MNMHVGGQVCVYVIDKTEEGRILGMYTVETLYIKKATPMSDWQLHISSQVGNKKNLKGHFQ